jgi:hypothetical protein
VTLIEEEIDMPFDGTQIETPALRRAILVDALRHEMPTGFAWDFRKLYSDTGCGSEGCALGLASLIWPDHANMLLSYQRTGEIAEFFGISARDAYRIFWDEGTRAGFVYRRETPRPTTVARELERAPVVVPDECVSP